jgi:hypothetical protein
MADDEEAVILATNESACEFDQVSEIDDLLLRCGYSPLRSNSCAHRLAFGAARASCVVSRSLGIWRVLSIPRLVVASCD